MTEQEFGSRTEAAQRLEMADAIWREAIRALDDYEIRLRRLADAAEGERKAMLFADLCNVRWRPRKGTQNLRLAPELEPPLRRGPPELWATFDHAREHFGEALGGNSLMAIAQAFGDMSQALTAIADASREAAADTA
jgi:hypothetical protein